MTSQAGHHGDLASDEEDTPPNGDYNVRKQCTHTSLVLAGRGILSEDSALCFCLHTFSMALQPAQFVQNATLSREALEESVRDAQLMWDKRARQCSLHRTRDAQEKFTQAQSFALDWLSKTPFPLPQPTVPKDAPAGTEPPVPSLAFNTHVYLLRFLQLVHLLLGLRGAAFCDWNLSCSDSSEHLTGMPWFGPVPPTIIREVVKRIMRDVHAMEDNYDFWCESSFDNNLKNVAGISDHAVQELLKDVDTIIVDNVPLSFKGAGGADEDALQAFRDSVNTADGDAPSTDFLIPWTRERPRTASNVGKFLRALMRARADGYLLEAVADPAAATVDRVWRIFLLDQDVFELAESSNLPELDDVRNGLQELVHLIQRAQGRLEHANMRLRLWTPPQTGEPSQPRQALLTWALFWSFCYGQI